MERLEITRFYAITYSHKRYEFIVYDDNTIDCPVLDLYQYERIVIKPDFVMYKGEDRFVHKINKEDFYRSDGIKRFNVDEEDFKYLEEKKMILYTEHMAYYYGLKTMTPEEREKERVRCLRKGLALDHPLKKYYQ